MLYNSIVKNKFDNSQLYVVYYTSAGDNREKVPPVLISNTEVKLLIVENTWLETVRKDRTLPAHLNKTPERVFFCCLNNVPSVSFLFKKATQALLAFRSPSITHFASLKFHLPKQDFNRSLSKMLLMQLQKKFMS